MTEAEEERMDRLEDALHRIAVWSEAYPFTVFPEPDAASLAKGPRRAELNRSPAGKVC